MRTVETASDLGIGRAVSANQSSYWSKTNRLLLVEDDAKDELITRESLEHNKLQNGLHLAHDGEECLNYLYRRGGYEDAVRPDLILLD